MNGLLVRSLVLLTVLLGTNYVVWRWLESVNWSAWWIAVPLVLAETYGLVNVSLFGLTVWRTRSRTEAGAPPPGATADVVVTAGVESLDVVLRTALAARAVRRAHSIWVVDGAPRPGLAALAAEHGLGYRTRGGDRSGTPPPGGAGGLRDVLTAGRGQFVLVLEAGQVPDPDVLDRTLGWFGDARVAVVQLPEHRCAAPVDPPHGRWTAPAHGPLHRALQRGRDGWDAALFCGSGAVLRREALVQACGPVHPREFERDLKRSLLRTRAALKRARRCPEAADPVIAGMLDDVGAAARRARADLKSGVPLTELVPRLRQDVDAAARRTVTQDFAQIQADLAAIAALDLPPEGGMVWPEDLASAVDRMSRPDLSPLAAVEPVREVLEAVSVELPGPGSSEAPPVRTPLEECVAASLRLHGQGWRIVDHDEVLVRGPAPEDRAALIEQHSRRTEGTVRALLCDNLLLRPGLGTGRRLTYLAMLWSSFGGFASAVWFAVPITHLALGVLPVTGLGPELFLRLVPFLVVHQLLVLVVGGGLPAWREQLLQLALFPVRIRACASAARSAWSGHTLQAPPAARHDGGRRLLRPQLVVAALLAAALAAGAVRLAAGLNEPGGTLVAAAWAVLDLAALGALVTAARAAGRASQRRSTDALHH